jgi:hypothetical protein
MDGPGGAANHANGILAMHAGMGEHPGSVLRALPHKNGISCMSAGACSHTVVAPRAALHVDDHGLTTIHQTLIYQKLQQAGFDVMVIAAQGRIQDWLTKLISRRLDERRKIRISDKRQQMLQHRLLGNPQNIYITHSSQRVLIGQGRGAW